MMSWLFGDRGRSPSPGRSRSRLDRPGPSIERLEDRAVPAVIGGTVYADLNNNGIRDAGEPGIAGSTIQLNGLIGHTLATATTDTSGHYQFDLPSISERTAEDVAALRDGYQYTVSQPHGPPGYLGGKLTDDNVKALFVPACSRSIVVRADGIDQLNLNFGELRTASLSGSVMLDTAGKAGSAGGTGAVVNLTGTDDKGAAVSHSRTTVGDGSYNFGDLRPGAYGLTVNPPASFDVTRSHVGPLMGLATLNGVAGISVSPGGIETKYDFTLTRSASDVTLTSNTGSSGSVPVQGSGDTVPTASPSFEELLLSFQRSLASMNWALWGS